MLYSMTTTENRISLDESTSYFSAANVRRAQRFAGRLLAEGYGPDASDEEMQTAFANCVRPLSSDYYPLVRMMAVRLRLESAEAR